HRRCIARPRIGDVLIHRRKRAKLAVRALRDIDDHVPLLHRVTLPHFAGTREAALSERFISASLSIRAKVSDMCSLRPSHSPPCTRELAPAMEWVDLVCVRSGVSRLRHPPRSTDLPGSPRGSYTA